METNQSNLNIKRVKLNPKEPNDFILSEDLTSDFRGGKFLKIDLSQLHLERSTLTKLVNHFKIYQDGFVGQDFKLFLIFHYKSYKLLIGFHASRLFNEVEFILEWDNVSQNYAMSSSMVLQFTIRDEAFFVVISELFAFKFLQDTEHSSNVLIEYIDNIAMPYISIDSIQSAHDSRIKELRLEELKDVYDRLIGQLEVLENEIIVSSIDLISFGLEEPELFQIFVNDLQDKLEKSADEFYFPVNKDFLVTKQELIVKYKLKLNDKANDFLLGFVSFSFDQTLDWDKSDRYGIVQLSFDSATDLEVIKGFYATVLDKIQRLDLDQDFTLEFSLNVFPEKKKYERVKSSILEIENDNVLNNVLVKNVLSPETINFKVNYKEPKKRKFDVLIDEINQTQQTSLNKMLNMSNDESPFMFVQGPPGTGKTTVITKLIEKLYKDGMNVLVTSNTHVAIDNVVERVRGDKDLMIHRFTTLDSSKQEYEAQVMNNKMNYLWNQVYSFYTVQDEFGNSYDVDNIEQLYLSVQTKAAKYDESIFLISKNIEEVNLRKNVIKSELRLAKDQFKELEKIKSLILTSNQRYLELKDCISNYKKNIEKLNYIKISKSNNLSIEVSSIFEEIEKIIHISPSLRSELEYAANADHYEVIQVVNNFLLLSSDIQTMSQRELYEFRTIDKITTSFKVSNEIHNALVWLKENYVSKPFKRIIWQLGLINSKGINYKKYNFEYGLFLNSVKKVSMNFIKEKVHLEVSNKILTIFDSLVEPEKSKLVKECGKKENITFNQSSELFESLLDIKAETIKLQSKITKHEIDIKELESNEKEAQLQIEEILEEKNRYLDKFYKLEKLKKNALKYGVDFSLISHYLKDIKKIKNMSFHEKIDKLESIPGRLFKLDNKANSNFILAMTTNQVAQVFKKGNTIEFNYTIVDEASKCTIEDVLVSLPNTEKMIILGDVLQLVPERQDHPLLSFEDQELHKRVNESILDTFYNQFKIGGFELSNHETFQAISILSQQYRMDQPIFDLISRIYLNEKILLTNEKADQSDHMDSIIFVNTRNNYYLDKQRGELINEDELLFIKKFIAEISQNEVRERLISENTSIGIISYYRAQVNRIDSIISEYKDVLKGIQIRVGSVDRFQGMEFDIVIISSVRRRNRIIRNKEEAVKHIGFLSNRNRVNVSLSRARKKLVFLSDSDFIHSLHEDDIILERDPNNPYVDIYKERNQNKIVIDVFKALLPYQVDFDDQNILKRILGNHQTWKK